VGDQHRAVRGEENIFLSDECQADPDEDLGRTEIDAARGDFDLRIVAKGTAEDCDHDGSRLK
jgi:hypothetical protein